MGQGAASSNGGDNSCGANCVDNHVSHAIGDGDGVVRVSGGETGKLLCDRQCWFLANAS
jgi:homocitrate synthase